ncbi:Hypothetical protein D9617_100g032550 [Elsinoe fawcettii]|nr:Hypothetical protein D9617_100g032550 [Elsinoe fawcettii]
MHYFAPAAILMLTFDSTVVTAKGVLAGDGCVCAAPIRSGKDVATAVLMQLVDLDLYYESLQPLQEAAVRLQGHGGGRFGCIWQVLPAFEYLLRHFEEQRQRYPMPAESSQLDRSLTTSESYFSTACNLGWQKLDEYYTKLDESPAYVAAVVLHPRLKWRCFRRWPEAWLTAAKISFSKLWSHYAAKQPDASRRASRPPRKNDWFSDEDDEGAEVDEHDELNQYLVEHRPAELTVDDSPISYSLVKRQRWPRLSSLALDIYAVPAMSDSPERLFSQAGDAISSRRRLLHSETVEWLMSLKSWISSGLITLDPSLFGRILETTPPVATTATTTTARTFKAIKAINQIAKHLTSIKSKLQTLQTSQGDLRGLIELIMDHSASMPTNFGLNTKLFSNSKNKAGLSLSAMRVAALW